MPWIVGVLEDVRLAIRDVFPEREKGIADSGQFSGCGLGLLYASEQGQRCGNEDRGVFDVHEVGLFRI
jgi:hypothetical protein